MLTALELKLKTKEKMIWGLSSGSCWGWRERGEDRSAKKTENEGWQVERKPLGKWMVLEAKEGKKYLKGMVINWVRDYWFGVGESYDCSFDLIR